MQWLINLLPVYYICRKMISNMNIACNTQNTFFQILRTYLLSIFLLIFKTYSYIRMETPYIIYCDVKKTYCTNLITITKNIYRIGYVVNNNIHYVEDIISGYKYVNDCQGITVYFEELDFTNINIDTFSGFKLTKVILCNVNTIHNITVDTLILHKSFNINTIHDIEIKTLESKFACITSIYNIVTDDLNLFNSIYIGDIHHILTKTLNLSNSRHVESVHHISADMLNLSNVKRIQSVHDVAVDTLNLSNVDHIQSVHDIAVITFYPPKTIDYLFNVTIPTLDLSKSKYVKTIHDIKTIEFIGCEKMENIYNITIDTLDLSTTENMNSIHTITVNIFIPPTRRIQTEIHTIKTKILDLSRLFHVANIYNLNVDKLIGGTMILSLSDSTIQTLDLSLCNCIAYISGVKYKTFHKPNCISKTLNIKRIE